MTPMSTDLPSELWIDILEQATCIKGALDTSYVSPLDRPSFKEQEAYFRTTYTETLATKRALALVSRAFNALSLHILYEIIIISSESHMAHLCFALAQTRKPGRFIRRLHVEYRDHKPVLTYQQLEGIFSLVPDLQICVLKHSGFRDVPHHCFENYLGALCAALRESLRHFTYHNTSEGPVNYNDLCTYLRRVPALRTISLRLGRLAITRVRVEPPLILPYLHTCDIDDNTAGWLAQDAPTPRHWTLPSATFFPGTRIGLPPVFFDTPNLTTAIYYMHQTSRIYRTSITDWPHLSEAIFVDSYTPLFKFATPFIRIGLDNSSSLTPSTQYSVLHRWHTPLKNIYNSNAFPRLAAITIMHIPASYWTGMMSRDIVNWFIWYYWIAKFGERGISLEVQGGAPVILPPRPVFWKSDYESRGCAWLRENGIPCGEDVGRSEV